VKYTLREFIVYTFMVIALFIALTHAGGLAKNIGALGTTYAQGVHALQGV